jgi:hypothetical protein
MAGFMVNAQRQNQMLDSSLLNELGGGKNPIELWTTLPDNIKSTFNHNFNLFTDWAKTANPKDTGFMDSTGDRIAAAQNWEAPPAYKAGPISPVGVTQGGPNAFLGSDPVADYTPRQGYGEAGGDSLFSGLGEKVKGAVGNIPLNTATTYPGAEYVRGTSPKSLAGTTPTTAEGPQAVSNITEPAFFSNYTNTSNGTVPASTSTSTFDNDWLGGKEKAIADGTYFSGLTGEDTYTGPKMGTDGILNKDAYLGALGGGIDVNNDGTAGLGTSVFNNVDLYNEDKFNPIDLKEEPGMFQGAMNWLGENKDGINAGIGLAQTGLGLYTGLKGMGLAEDQFNLNKDMQQKKLAMYREQMNNTYATKARMLGGNAQDYKNANTGIA